MGQPKSRVPPHDINVAIRLFEQGDPAGSARLCRAALVGDPGALPERIVLASALLASRDMYAALTEAEAVLAADPAVAAAHFIRGTALLELRRGDEAAVALQQAVALAPGDPTAWLNLGVTLTRLDRLEAATHALFRACELAPGSAEAHASLGTALVRSLRLPDAIAAYRTALRLRPDFAAAAWDLGFALLLGGDFTQGFAALRRRKPEEDAVLARRGAEGPEWDGTALNRRTLLVCAGQGAGDTIMLARYLPLLAGRGIRVLLACDARLVPLLGRMPDVAAVLAPGRPLPRHDAWVALSSLPHLFGTKERNIPSPSGYLKADPARIDHWRNILAEGGPHGPTIGIVWAGNPAHENDASRSMPPESLAPLLRVRGLRFVSLQRDAGDPPAWMTKAGVIDLAPHLTDFGETAAVLRALDLVVTVDTATAHLAGALGRPAWVLLPHAPDWRWLLGRDGSPWYRSVRLFRQPRPGDWDSVIANAASALAAALPGASAS